MLTKGKITLFMTLCILSLVSIGFASWTITGEAEEVVSGGIETDKVVFSKEYIELNSDKGENSSGINCFKYYEKGYLDSDGYLSNYGYITTYYKIEYAKLKELINLLGSESDTISVKFELQYSDEIVLGSDYYNIFAGNTTSEGSSSITSLCNYSETYASVPSISYTQQSEKDYPGYSVNLVFSNILKNYDEANSPEFICFEIKYILFATIGDYFEENIYSFLYSRMLDSSSDFKVEISLSGV